MERVRADPPAEPARPAARRGADRAAVRRSARLWNRTGSLFLLGLLHAAGNAAATGSGFGTGGALRHLYPGNTVVGSLYLLAFVVIGLVVLAVTKGRIGPIRKIQ